MQDSQRAVLRHATDDSTVVTDMSTGRPARYIRNGLTDDLIGSGLEPVSFPAQMSLTAPRNGREQSGNREKRKPKAAKPKPASGQSRAFRSSGWHLPAERTGQQEERQQAFIGLTTGHRTQAAPSVVEVTTG